MIAGLVAVVAAGWWFAGRARLGARVRAMAGVRLGLVERAGTLFTPAARGRAGLATLTGLAFGGAFVAAVAAVGAVAAEPWVARRRAHARVRALDRQTPDLLRAIASSLRSGRSLTQAIEDAAAEAVAPMHELLEAARRAIAFGAPLERVVRDLGDAGGEALREAADTIALARSAGAELPSVLDRAVATLAERERVAAERRAATAQARSSAAIVGSLPAVFFLMVGADARREFATLLREPAGWALLGAGLLLEVAGIAWLRRLAP